METLVTSDCAIPKSLDDLILTSESSLSHEKDLPVEVQVASTEALKNKNVCTFKLYTSSAEIVPNSTSVSEYSQTEYAFSNLGPLANGVQDLRNEFLEQIQRLEKNIRQEVEERLAREISPKESASKTESNVAHICLRCCERDGMNFVNQSTQTFTVEMIEQNWLLYKMTTQFDNLKQFLTEQFKQLYERHSKSQLPTIISNNVQSYQNNKNHSQISYSPFDSMIQSSVCKKLPAVTKCVPNSHATLHIDEDKQFVTKQKTTNISYPYQQSIKLSQTPSGTIESSVLYKGAHKYDMQLLMSPIHKGRDFEKTAQNSREELARKLVEDMFEYEELAHSNVSGVKGKKLLDPGKINAIRETVFCRYPAGKLEQEGELWKLVCEKINAKCRGVTRTLKRKSFIDGDTFSSMDNCKSMDIKIPFSPNGEQTKQNYVDLNNNLFGPETRLSRPIYSNKSHLPGNRFCRDKDSDHVNFSSKKELISPPNKCHFQKEKRLAEIRVSELFSSDSCSSSGFPTPTEPESLNSSGPRKFLQKIKDEDLNEDELNLSGPSHSMNEAYHEIENELSNGCDSVLSDDIIIVHAAELDCESYETSFDDSTPFTDESPRFSSCTPPVVDPRVSIPATSRLRLSSPFQPEQLKREEMTRNLIESMFTRDELANSNVTGARGKSMLDPSKINQVRKTVFSTYPVKAGEEEEWLWRTLVTKINTKCRGVKRLMKRNAQIFYDELEDQRPKYVRISRDEKTPTMACNTYSNSPEQNVRPHSLCSDVVFSCVDSHSPQEDH